MRSGFAGEDDEAGVEGLGEDLYAAGDPWVFVTPGFDWFRQQANALLDAPLVSRSLRHKKGDLCGQFLESFAYFLRKFG